MKTLLDDGARSKDQAQTKAGEKLSGETLAIRGGRPLTGRVEVKGAKNLATKAMVAALLGETTSVLRDVPDISDVQVVRSLLEVHGVTVRRRRRRRLARLRPERCRLGALRGDRRARRCVPHPDPVLRSAAAPARRGAHPRPRRMPHRRPADQLPHGRAARVRRDRRQDLRGHPHHRPGRPARREHRAAVPERRRDRAGAADRRAGQGRHRAAQRGDRARDHGPDRGAAEDGRDHLVRAQPGDPHRGRRLAPRATTTAASSTATRPPRGRAPRSRPTATSSSAARSSRRC